ncbi:MAG: hypothetical protein KDA65_14455 [Planctomycetaceae bacterium]|nr:hypothetical protein [Planctomycetaceae bacterium]
MNIEKQVDWRYIFDRLCEVCGDTTLGTQPEPNCTWTEFNLHYLNSEIAEIVLINTQWICTAWGIPHREITRDEKVRLFCEHAASHVQLLEIQCNEQSLFDCWPAAIFRAFQYHLENSGNNDRIKPSTRIDSLSGRELLQAISKIELSLPERMKPETYPYEMRFRLPLNECGGLVSRFFYALFHIPVVVLREMIAECNRKTDEQPGFYVLYYALWFILMVVFACIGRWGYFGFFAMTLLLSGLYEAICYADDWRQSPQHLDHLRFENAVTLKDVCRLMGDGIMAQR